MLQMQAATPLLVILAAASLCMPQAAHGLPTLAERREAVRRFCSGEKKRCRDTQEDWLQLQKMFTSNASDAAAAKMVIAEIDCDDTEGIGQDLCKDYYGAKRRMPRVLWGSASAQTRQRSLRRYKGSHKLAKWASFIEKNVKPKCSKDFPDLCGPKDRELASDLTGMRAEIAEMKARLAEYKADVLSR
eukprot:TRINITY_DN11258_c0_g1_i3.p1 TRINITY_DN11258_c0_g1~~TRINITY_DN11258_c0_g1_i3.p1  ORF type:complete len:188 (+),score=53.41 TRINITY_DN11258_c0_g1_i3:92-655(+)